MTLAASMMMISAACASLPGKTARELPEMPASFSPEPVPRLSVGDDARIALARHRNALGRANTRLAGARRWYDDLRQLYRTGAAQ
jgi:hypothetical protein